MWNEAADFLWKCLFQTKLIWTGEKCHGCSGVRSVTGGREVVYSSGSYLTDTALKWKIMNQIQEAQDPCKGIALLQVFESVTHVSSPISKVRNKNWIQQIYGEEVLGLFHCLPLVHDPPHTTDQVSAKAASEMRVGHWLPSTKLLLLCRFILN